MSNVLVRVYIDRTAAILAGSAVFGAQTFDIDPAQLSETQRKTLVRCPFEADAYSLKDAKTKLARADYATAGEIVPMLLDEIGDVFRQKDEEQRKYRAQMYATARNNVEKWLAEPDEDLVKIGYFQRHSSGRYSAVEPYGQALDHLKVYGKEFSQPEEIQDLGDQAAEKLARLKILAEQKNRRIEADEAERAAKHMIEMERVEKEREARQARQVRQLAEWVEVHGTENQKKRFAKDLLPKEEILADMRNYAFASLDTFGRYRRLTRGDVLDVVGEEYDTEEDVSFSTSDATEASAEEFEALEAIESTIGKVYPEAQVKLIDHRGETERSNEIAVRKAIQVTIPFGDFEFTREYAAPLEAA
jgi:hypothetical protein